MRIAIALLLAAGLAWAFARAPARTLEAGDGRPQLGDGAVAATFTYGPGVDAYARQAIESAIAGARPEARRLIERVDGLVALDVRETGSGALGYAKGREGGYEVVVDLARIRREHGARGITRAVLHELGHVVDFQMLDDGLRSSLDGGIPRGYGCHAGEATGSCATREERFAESFAKWATGDIGVNLYVGYAIPPPSMGLDAWGVPLAAL